MRVPHLLAVFLALPACGGSASQTRPANEGHVLRGDEGDRFTEVRGARSLVASGADTRRVEVRQAGSGCGGGGCTAVLESRPDPSLGLQYSWTDNSTGQYPGPYLGCPEGFDREKLFADWTVVELAPMAEGSQADCRFFDEQQRQYVILRFATARP